ncbi:MAG: hypothetical protein Ct9H300mP11_16360 [Chloroflexota bacterium]|nr:MAG: hypothetical protein Ct9H300mP11_16360 [Chloroflexota bacterium]
MARVGFDVGFCRPIRLGSYIWKDRLDILFLTCNLNRLVPVAALMRLVRSSMLEVMDSEYIKMARVKGLSEAKVVWKQASEMPLSPANFFWNHIWQFIGFGGVSIETVYAWPGVGLLAFEAVLARDFPVMQAVVVIFAAIYIV